MKKDNNLFLILLTTILFVNFSFAQLPSGLNKLKDAGSKVKTEKNKVENRAHPNCFCHIFYSTLLVGF